MKYNEETIMKNGEKNVIEEAFEISDPVVMSAVVREPVVATTVVDSAVVMSEVVDTPVVATTVVGSAVVMSAVVDAVVVVGSVILQVHISG
jgi:hypothetical protein